MKSAFTILELIIIIVILGVLSAIAMPKFIHISDEAQAHKNLANLKTFISDLSLYYDTHESTFPELSNNSISDFSNVKNITFIKSLTDPDTKRAGLLFALNIANTPDCIQIKAINDELVLIPNAQGSNGCKITIAAAAKAGILDANVQGYKITQLSPTTSIKLSGDKLSEIFAPAHNKPSLASPH